MTDAPDLGAVEGPHADDLEPGTGLRRATDGDRDLHPRRPRRADVVGRDAGPPGQRHGPRRGSVGAADTCERRCRTCPRRLGGPWRGDDVPVGLPPALAACASPDRRGHHPGHLGGDVHVDRTPDLGAVLEQFAPHGTSVAAGARVPVLGTSFPVDSGGCRAACAGRWGSAGRGACTHGAPVPSRAGRWGSGPRGACTHGMSHPTRRRRERSAGPGARWPRRWPGRSWTPGPRLAPGGGSGTIAGDHTKVDTCCGTRTPRGC